LASLLDIVRLQSTDMMREIIRCYMTPHVAPTLEYSSFDAWRGLPEVDPGLSQSPASDLVVSGFLAQFGTVKVALEATVARAIKEGEHLIVEGVHVLPSRLALATIADKALVIPLMLAVTTRDRLEEHLTRRSHEQPDRDGERHRLMLEEIWTLQSFMVDQAERNGIPVIAARGADETVASIMEEVMDRVIERFPPILEDSRRRSRRRTPRQTAVRTQARHGDSR
jgi:2-phosphoglycerate kinase